MDKCSSWIVHIKKRGKFNKMQCHKNEMERKETEYIPYTLVIRSLMYSQARVDDKVIMECISEKLLRRFLDTNKAPILHAHHKRSNCLEVIDYSNSYLRNVWTKKNSNLVMSFFWMDTQYHGRI